MNLRIKLFTAFLSLVIIPLFIVGIITFFAIFHYIETKYSDQAEYALKSISYSITGVFEEMDKVTDDGIAKGVFQMALNSGNPDNQNLTAKDQLSLNANQRNFRSLLYNHPSIDYAFLYNLKEGAQDKPISIFNKEDFKMLPFEKFKQEPLYQEVLNLKGQSKWIAPHEYPELTGSEQVFTQIRLIKELSYLQNVGILIVQVKNWEFEDIFKNLQQRNHLKDTRFLLVNDEGMILYDYQNKLDGHPMSEYTGKSIAAAKGSYKSFKARFDGKESVVSVYHLQDYSWSLVSVTSWDYLSREVMTFAAWFMVILGICVLTAMLFNAFFMNRITGTIGIIVRFMRKVEDGDLNARVEEKGNDELLLLLQGFNNLTEKIGGLLEEVKAEQQQKAKAELRVLQAQIKPHFLFNTLELINGLAVQNEGRKVSEMVLRLGNILRISIQDREEIPLWLELEHLTSYLEIQKYRWDDLFDYTIDIPEEMLNYQVLKLMLQPLVENSIQHGFEGIPYKGELRISGRVEEDRILLRIEDNGTGMTEAELLSNLNLDAESNEQQMQTYYPGEERRGIGLRNVADRIRLQYGKDYGLFICTAPGMGVAIQCILPKYELGDPHEA
ncbi:cache domain-containing sensor histidine kinase [Paenibacillus physcomitrellae]|uniref:Sensor histidine kinase n=1 Tax=Paenibacillus physcomitrellae TaxID=1619311 RepID=A0ABQ1FN32_9BACL|nr:sensor histidine kinase [Paenibacillus physcomitrellae]GGA22178.1 sensor histidine kinase [Paenibacillus physcomitrellae]